MAVGIVLFILAVISIALAVRSWIKMNQKLHEVEEVEKTLRKGKIIFQDTQSSLSSSSSKEED